MAKDKDDKKNDDKASSKNADLSPEEAAAKSKKKKIIILAVGGGALIAGAGVTVALLPFGGGGDKMAAKSTGAEHGPAPEPAGHDKPPEAMDPDKGAATTPEKSDAKHDAKHDAKGEAHPAANSKDEKNPKHAKLDGVDFGCTHPMTPFHLNLGNPLENRYVRLELALEYGCTDEIKQELEKRLPQLRDAIITVTSRKTREFLLGPDGKEQLRKEIHTQINYHMSRKIDDVYITDILIE